MSLPKLEAILNEQKEIVLKAESTRGGGGEQQFGGLGADFPPSIFPPDIFPPNFMSSVVNSLDDSTDLDGFGLFANHRSYNDLNFERDFAEWFTPNPVEDALIR